MKQRIFVLSIIILLLLFGCGTDNVTNPTPVIPNTVTIGTQVWMLRNLDVSNYRNGDEIPYVSDTNQWAQLKTGAWCWYNNDPSNDEIYGKLYNWYAVNDLRGLAPESWHVPSDSDWTKMTKYLGGDYEAYGKLKESGTDHWKSPNIGATNESCFSALPGGLHAGSNGGFYNQGTKGFFWTSTANGNLLAWSRLLYNDMNYISRISNYKVDGLSVRCFRNIPFISKIMPMAAKPGDEIIITGTGFWEVQNASIVSFNGVNASEFISWSDTLINVKLPMEATSGKVSVTVWGQESNLIGIIVIQNNQIDIQIGTQTWMLQNLDVDHYRNGDPIPQVTGKAEWAKLKTGAWCYYNNDSVYGKIYGKLYNWYAVNDPRGLAPSGWHVPSYTEFSILIDSLGGQSVAGCKLKEYGTVHWISPNVGATNESGFSALPGGFRGYNGVYYYINVFGDWWTSTSRLKDTGSFIHLGNNDYKATTDNYFMVGGFSVRCIKD